jgi:glycosyltransferase involved in cell wall biosynthesis
MRKISVIICSYNQGTSIKNIIPMVSEYFFDEIIVVNNGSTDRTYSILNELNAFYDFKVIELNENMGKGHAMAIGIENTDAEILIFIDTDLFNLQERHLVQLIKPLYNEEADIVFGQAEETIMDYKMTPFKSFDFERAFFKKDILPILNDLKLSKFKVDTLLDFYCLYYKKRVKYVMLEGLKQVPKT